MLRTIIVYGAISGAVVIVSMILGFSLSGVDNFFSSQVFGYLMMIIGLSVIFVAIKRHRDSVLGGVIKFFPALAIGLGIAAVAGVAYVIVWEIYLAMTDYAFAADYAQAQIAAIETRELEPEERERALAQVEQMQQMYANPLFRLPITFSEIFRIGLLVSIVSAALLRNPKFAPNK